MNLFKAIKEVWLASELLKARGLWAGDLVSSVRWAIKCMDDSLTKAASEVVEDPACTYAYFIPYDISSSQHPNGGKIGITKGMTIIHVDGGIRNWSQIMGVQHFLMAQEPARNLNNPQIRINGIFKVGKVVE